MDKVLSISLRPKSFKTLFGQQVLIDGIRKQIKSGRIPAAWMLIGETGSGKTTVARIIARAFNCTHNKAFGAFCKVCYTNVDQMNVYEVNAAHYKGIDDVKQLVQHAIHAPIPPALYRVFILDEAQQLSSDAQNLLLKYFEDPPDFTKWIICTTDPRKIKPALAGRCGAGTYALAPLRGRAAEEFVHWAAAKVHYKKSLDEFIEFVHTEDLTSPRNILGALEKLISGIDPDRTLVAKSDVNTLAICKSLVAGEWDGIRPQLERATMDDCEVISSAVIGFLRAMLLKKSSGLKRRLLAYAIQEIAGVSNWGVSEQIRYATLCAKLYSLSEVFPEGNMPRR